MSWFTLNKIFRQTAGRYGQQRLFSTFRSGGKTSSRQQVAVGGAILAAIGFGVASPLTLSYARSKFRADGPAVSADDFVAPTMDSGHSADWRKKAAEWNWNWDMREKVEEDKEDSAEDKDEETKKKKKKYRGSRYIIMVRHGHYMNHGADNDMEQGLSPKGNRQITLAAEHLQRYHEKVGKITSITHSDMQRVKDSAKIISEHLPDVTTVINDPNLNEGMPILPVPRMERERFLDCHIDGPRIEHAFRKHFYRPRQEKDSFEVIVSHGNVIRYFVCRALQVPPERWLNMSPMNASITTIVIRPNGRCSLRAFGEVGHIPPEEVTWN